MTLSIWVYLVIEHLIDETETTVKIREAQIGYNSLVGATKVKTKGRPKSPQTFANKIRHLQEQNLSICQEKSDLAIQSYDIVLNWIECFLTIRWIHISKGLIQN